jgi:Asp-tRNA(Asn)/Glu-tRNA(Gln) amidotransferase A subunit family amidase
MQATRFDRRIFLLGALSATAVRAGEALQPTTLTQWLQVSTVDRQRALQGCLLRIRELEPSIHAWASVSQEAATGQGKLSGIPFGVKDIIETRGLPTEYGSPLYKGRIGKADAAVVRALRSRGAILLGKTETTAFAYRTPAPTRNPRNLEHTPGGSSSGSAAAVAAGMVPFAVGEQTLGSVLRPASYCGVTGFKPTHGLLSMEGVLPLARSLDTLGFFTHGPDDMLALWDALGRPTGGDEDVPIGFPDPAPVLEPPMAAAFAAAIARVRAAGFRMVPVELVKMLATLNEAARTVMFYEGARFHRQRFLHYGDRLADLAMLVSEGLQMSDAAYDRARQVIAEGLKYSQQAFAAAPVILVPGATGPAPLGLSFTGDTSMNAPWTALGVPAISIPMAESAGLPLGLQIVAQRGQDARVLRAAVRLRQVLAGA